jgi:ABC-type Na+ efflux pump, permease component
MSNKIQESTAASANQGQTHPDAIITHKDGPRSEHAIHKIGLIASREFKTRIQQRSYTISLIVIAAIILIGTCVPTAVAFFTRGSASVNLTMINNAGTIANLDNTTLSQYFSRALNGTSSSASSSSSSTHFTLHSATASELNNLKGEVKNGKISILLVIERDATKNLHFTYYTNSMSGDSSNAPQVQGVANQLSTLDKASLLGLNTTQTLNLFAPPAFNIVSTQTSNGNNDLTQRLTGYFIGIAGMILILMSIMQYGVGVATGVAEEKGSRIMEILVNAASPFQLMTGKILGIGAAGLLQMLIQVIVGVLGFLIQYPLSSLLGVNSIQITLTLNPTTIMVFVLMLVYFILGFLMYATLFAAVGALVQRIDEVQSASAPVTTFIMIGYAASFIGGSMLITNPVTPTWFRIMSLIPFFTPTMMMIRAGAGAAPFWEIALSIVLLIVMVFVCLWISARIYRYGILMYGQKPSMKQLFKIVRQ